jgi:threonine dehydrogenase-like Zn-dependent dehydrogenase
MRLLYTEGTGKFFEKTDWRCPILKADEIKVKSIMTGICRSDIDMMMGKFQTLPLSMSGHEGLGEIVEVGSNISSEYKIGDYVATRGEPAYADFYNVKSNNFVRVPSVDPKYIIEPVACGINLILQAKHEFIMRDKLTTRILILGSGFLAWVAHTTILDNIRGLVDVVGNSNKFLWGNKLLSEPRGKYDIIIDLSSRDDVFSKDIINDNALIVMGTQKQVTTDFSNLLWKAATIVFPSPRSAKFYSCMVKAVKYIESGRLDVDTFWTKGYNRDTDWQQAFEDGKNRPSGYNRGYITWNQK